MQINKDTLNEILLAGRKKGFDIRIKDISYVLLCRSYEDKEVAYRSIFPVNTNIDKELKIYDNSVEVKFVRDTLNEVLPIISIKQQKKKTEEDISFEENKAYMLKLKKDTEKAIKDGEIDKKDGLKILADIAVKLNDKFKVHDDTTEQLVIVNVKYNSICECGREIYIPTKEDLMKEYGLIKK